MFASGSLLGHPGYVFKGKTYKTLTGLMTACARDAGDESARAQWFESPDVLCVGHNRGNVVIARYDLTRPVFGQKQTVTRRVENAMELRANGLAAESRARSGVA